MGTKLLKMLLKEMKSNIQEMEDIVDKVQRGEVSSKDYVEMLKAEIAEENAKENQQ